MVAGSIWDIEERNLRLDSTMTWIEDIINKHRQGIELVVLFGNSGISEKANQHFFHTLANKIQEWNYGAQNDLNLFYFHQGPKPLSLTEDVLGQNHFYVVNTKGGQWPPVMVEVDTERQEFRIDEEEWYEQHR